MKYWVGVIILLMVSAVWILYPRHAAVYVSEQQAVSRPDIETKSLLFVGDIMLGRYVETLGEKYGDKGFVFASTTELLKSHTTIANLEGPIPNEHIQTPINGFRFSFPSYVPNLLKTYGISAVSLANNHMFDYGRSGWEETKDALDKEGVSHFGGYSPTEADYFKTTLNGKEVVVYGITMIATGWDASQALMITDRIRKDHPDAYLVAFLHWGDEYATQNTSQKEFAHTLIDHGVDAIIGSHPHVVQGIEVYKGKPIFYSLGNFIFDQYWDPEVEKGYVLEVSSSNDDYSYRIIPIKSIRSVPYVAEKEERDQILVKIASQSAPNLQSSLEKGVLILPKK